MPRQAGLDRGGDPVHASAMPVVLASASPRRRELLETLGVDFTGSVSRFDESTLSLVADAAAYVCDAAEAKAQEVASRRSGWILGVDTDVVAPDGAILGKPVDSEAARRMLRSLRGRSHTVYSGVALLATSDIDDGITYRDVRVVSTRVTFSMIPDAAIDAYVATGAPLDKAGGYGIQERALAFISRIEGDPSNVIGLPLSTVAEMLMDAGVPLWRF